MFDLIEKLRAKPDGEKRRIALGVAATITALIFVIWLIVVINNISALSSLPDDSSNTPSPFSQIGESFSKVFDTMSNIFKRADSIVPQMDQVASSTSVQ